MVSEGDRLRPFGAANEMRRAWWLELLAEGDPNLSPQFVDYIRVDKRCVQELMTRDVVTATERTSLSAIADLMSKHRIKRVPILRDGKLVGIVRPRRLLVRAMTNRVA